MTRPEHVYKLLINLTSIPMTQSELHFEPTVFKGIHGNEKSFPMNDENRIDLILKELSAIYQREEKRPMGYNHLPYHACEYILEAIGLLEQANEWPEPIEDSYGEPPITMDEMHSAAWKEHQEMHR